MKCVKKQGFERRRYGSEFCEILSKSTILNEFVASIQKQPYNVIQNIRIQFTSLATIVA